MMLSLNYSFSLKALSKYGLANPNTSYFFCHTVQPKTSNFAKSSCFLGKSDGLKGAQGRHK
jgi:hypothetical protein